MDREELIDAIKTENTKLEKYLANFNDPLSQNYSDVWSIKDLIAHILWHEEEIAKLFETKSLHGASPLWQHDSEQRNDLIYEHMRDTALKELQDRRKEALRKILDVLMQVTHQDLIDPKRYDGMPDNWIPWEILAQNTFLHYNHHRRKT